MAARRRGSVKVLVQSSGAGSCSLTRVAGDDQGPALPLGDEFIEVVGLGCGQLAHGEVVEGEHVGPDQFTDPLLPGAVRVSAGQVREDPAGLGEADVGALADGEMIQGLRDMGLADANRPEQDDRLAGMQPEQGSEVADLCGGKFRGGGEVELLQGDLLLELRSRQAELEGDGLAAGDLVLAEDLQEVEVAEFAAVGLEANSPLPVGKGR